MRRRVLIVDDDPDIRETVQLLLELHGYEVDTAGDGIVATGIDAHYHAILVDLKMPVFDGARLMDYWQMTNAGLLRRVIVMSGYSHHEAARSFPAFAVVQKPFHPDHLLRVVHACVGGEPSASDSHEG